MKRILIFSLNYYPRFIGGAEVAIKEITDRINPEEIEFHMVTLRFDSTLPKIEKIGNVMVHRIGFAKKNPSIGDLKRMPLHLNKYMYQIIAVAKAHQLHKQYSFDGIWAMMAHATGSPAALFKAIHSEVTYLLTLQEGDPTDHIEKLARPIWFRPAWFFFSRAFTKADILQSISGFLLSWGTNMGFSGMGYVIPNGVDVELFSQRFSEAQKSEMQEKLSKKKGDIFLVTTSRLVHKNGIDDVIRALPLLPSNVTFLIYGIGPDEEMLRRLARELKVEERARFMGQIEHRDIPLVLSACDIFIRPSRSEGMGNSFIEAMAARVPVVATQEGGISDFMYDTKRNPETPTTGFVVDVNSPKQIVEVVTHIMSNPEVVIPVLDTASALVRENYNWAHSASDMKKIFVSMGPASKTR